MTKNGGRNSVSQGERGARKGENHKSGMRKKGGAQFMKGEEEKILTIYGTYPQGGKA